MAFNSRNRIYGGKTINLVLSGGGVKGIAYAGVFETGEELGYNWGNIAGVSAGALAGSFAGAGYSAIEIRRVLDEFDFEKIKNDEVTSKVPAVNDFIAYQTRLENYENLSALEAFLNKKLPEELEPEIFQQGYAAGRDLYRANMRNILRNIVIYSREKSMFNGDYLEEWVSKVLKAKGVRTFGDLRGGIADKANPRGYKVRMTAVDAGRVRIIVLPDDIAYYGIDPDEFEVAKAVRMSTAVPFAFKPVELKKLEGNSYKTHYIVDGGVLDNFPFWLIGRSSPIPTVGFKLDGGESPKLLSMDTPLNILKALISIVHDIGKPKGTVKLPYTAAIDTSKISFLDFGLDKEEKEYLINAGKESALILFNNFSRSRRFGLLNIFWLIRRVFGWD